MRWWIPAVILFGWVSAIARLYIVSDASRQVFSVLLTILAIVLLILWYVLFTQMSWRRRFLCLGATVLAAIIVVGGGQQTLRWQGSVSGGAVPRLVWRWSEEPEAHLAALEPKGSARVEEESGSYPRFLGPDGDGVLRGIVLERDWDAHPPRELWRRRIGLGWSGFAVAKGRALTQEQRGEKELVVAYVLRTGAPLWVHENGGRFRETMGGDGPRATPTIHGDRVYVMGATGIVDCLELEKGERIWSRDLLKELGVKNAEYGKASSPVVEGQRLIVTGGGKGGPSLVALDLETGETLWSAGEDASSYATPVVTSLAGERQIICNHANTVMGHDLDTGEVLWRYEWPAKWPKSSQPQVVGEDGVFLSASYGLGCAFLVVSREGDGFAVREAWRNNRMKTKFSNVCVREGYAYGLDEGRLACIEIKSGERMWKGGVYGYGQNLLVGDVLLVQAENGEVVLVEANPVAFVEAARFNALDGKTWNYPALAGKYLVVRNDREAVCFEVPLR